MMAHAALRLVLQQAVHERRVRGDVCEFFRQVLFLAQGQLFGDN
jgi:hypothetical protein